MCSATMVTPAMTSQRRLSRTEYVESHFNMGNMLNKIEQNEEDSGDLGLDLKVFFIEDVTFFQQDEVSSFLEISFKG